MLKNDTYQLYGGTYVIEPLKSERETHTDIRKICVIHLYKPQLKPSQVYTKTKIKTSEVPRQNERTYHHFTAPQPPIPSSPSTLSWQQSTEPDRGRGR
jgi:hypothetical protein